MVFFRISEPSTDKQVQHLVLAKNHQQSLHVFVFSFSKVSSPMEVEVITDPSQSHVPFADWDVEIVDLGEH